MLTILRDSSTGSGKTDDPATQLDSPGTCLLRSIAYPVTNEFR